MNIGSVQIVVREKEHPTLAAGPQEIPLLKENPMRRLAFALAASLVVTVFAFAGSTVMHLKLGDQQVSNLKKCASGNCIGVVVEVPLREIM